MFRLKIKNSLVKISTLLLATLACLCACSSDSRTEDVESSGKSSEPGEFYSYFVDEAELPVTITELWNDSGWRLEFSARTEFNSFAKCFKNWDYESNTLEEELNLMMDFVIEAGKITIYISCEELEDGRYYGTINSQKYRGPVYLPEKLIDYIHFEKDGIGGGFIDSELE